MSNLEEIATKESDDPEKKIVKVLEKTKEHGRASYIVNEELTKSYNSYDLVSVIF